MGMIHQTAFKRCLHCVPWSTIPFLLMFYSWLLVTLTFLNVSVVFGFFYDLQHTTTFKLIIELCPFRPRGSRNNTRWLTWPQPRGNHLQTADWTGQVCLCCPVWCFSGPVVYWTWKQVTELWRIMSSWHSVSFLLISANVVIVLRSACFSFF